MMATGLEDFMNQSETPEQIRVKIARWRQFKSRMMALGFFSGSIGLAWDINLCKFGATDITGIEHFKPDGSISSVIAVNESPTNRFIDLKFYYFPHENRMEEH